MDPGLLKILNGGQEVLARTTMKELRKIIPMLILNTFPERQTKYSKLKGKDLYRIPDGWPADIPFHDPNNKRGEHEKKPTKDELMKMVTQLVHIHKIKPDPDNSHQSSLTSQQETGIADDLYTPYVTQNKQQYSHLQRNMVKYEASHMDRAMRAMGALLDMARGLDVAEGDIARGLDVAEGEHMRVVFDTLRDIDHSSFNPGKIEMMAELYKAVLEAQCTGKVSKFRDCLDNLYAACQSQNHVTDETAEYVKKVQTIETLEREIEEIGNGLSTNLLYRDSNLVELRAKEIPNLPESSKMDLKPNRMEMETEIAISGILFDTDYSAQVTCDQITCDQNVAQEEIIPEMCDSFQATASSLQDTASSFEDYCKQYLPNGDYFMRETNNDQISTDIVIVYGDSNVVPGAANAASNTSVTIEGNLDTNGKTSGELQSGSGNHETLSDIKLSDDTKDNNSILQDFTSTSNSNETVFNEQGVLISDIDECGSMMVNVDDSHNSQGNMRVDVPLDNDNDISDNSIIKDSNSHGRQITDSNPISLTNLSTHHDTDRQKTLICKNNIPDSDSQRATHNQATGSARDQAYRPSPCAPSCELPKPMAKSLELSSSKRRIALDDNSERVTSSWKPTRASPLEYTQVKRKRVDSGQES